MRLAWLTDIHLNFVDALAMRRFFEFVAEQADAVAVSGDIAESHDVCHSRRRTEVPPQPMNSCHPEAVP